MAEEPALALPSIQGWLEVRLRKLPIWRRRYCTLCATQLRCFDSLGGKLKSVYTIENIVHWDGEGRIFKYDPNCALSIEASGGTLLQIICPSAHSCEQWKLKLERSLRIGQPRSSGMDSGSAGDSIAGASTTTSSAAAVGSSSSNTGVSDSGWTIAAADVQTPTRAAESGDKKTGARVGSAADVEVQARDDPADGDDGGMRRVSMQDFSLLRVLGKGSFGKVMLVRKHSNGSLYAMKSLQKRKMQRMKQSQHVLTERDVVQKIRHPFLVNLCFAFQTAEKLYLVLEYKGGGDLYYWLQQQNTFSASRVQLYAAELVLGLEALHAHDVIYRDMKPENLLLDMEGHVHITDFGLAKGGVSAAGEEGGTKTLCGSPEYVAPEILKGRPHGKAVDWWSLGAVLYELLLGAPPFYHENKQQMFAQTLRAQVFLPPDTPPSTQALLLGLLNRDVAQRLGSGWQPQWGTGISGVGGNEGDTAAGAATSASTGASASVDAGTSKGVVTQSKTWLHGASELRAHPYFSGLDWRRVLARGYEPEFRPPAQADPTAAAHFDKEFTDQLPQDSVVVDSVLSSTGNSPAGTFVRRPEYSSESFPGFSFDGRAELQRSIS